MAVKLNPQVMVSVSIVTLLSVGPVHTLLGAITPTHSLHTVSPAWTFRRTLWNIVIIKLSSEESVCHVIVTPD